MWAKYFGEGTKTVGIDIDPRCLEYTYDHQSEIVIGNQGDPEFWNEFYKTHSTFDFVIDDGGHNMDQQTLTLERCWPYLNDGGVIMIEDTHTSYFNSHGAAGDNNFMKYVGSNLIHIPTHQFWVRSDVDDKLKDLFIDLHSVSVYNSIVVFEKRKHTNVECLSPTKR